MMTCMEIRSIVDTYSSWIEWYNPAYQIHAIIFCHGRKSNKQNIMLVLYIVCCKSDPNITYGCWWL
jgi:hypothetical protein